MLLCESHLGILAAAILDNTDGTVEEVSTDTLSTVAKASRPGSDDAFAPAEAHAPAPVSAPSANGRHGGEARLKPENEGSDQGAAVASADDEVSLDAFRALEP